MQLTFQQAGTALRQNNFSNVLIHFESTSSFFWGKSQVVMSDLDYLTTTACQAGCLKQLSKALE